MAEVKLKEETELWDPAEHNNSVEPPHIKEEPELCIKQEPEEFPFHMVSVKTEDDEDKSSVLHQRATEENREETNGEDCGAEAGCSSDPLTQLHSDSEEHTDSSSDTDHSEDYSQEQAPSKRSYAMISPDSSVTDVGGTDRPYSCSECGKGFENNSALQRHMSVHTGKRPFKCSVCEKCFKQKAHLFSHEIIHIGDKSFKCPVCEEQFAVKLNLKEHMKTHVEDGILDQFSVINPDSSVTDVGGTNRPYRCSECGKGFLQNFQLQRHCLIFPEQRPFICSVCEKAFTAKCNLTIHMRTHTGERPYVCSVCEKFFQKKSDFTRHLKVQHHICSVCKKGFVMNCDLKEHMWTHVEDGTLNPDSSVTDVRANTKPHKCSECGKRFKSKSDSQRHMLVHTREKPHKCLVCETTFAQKSCLYRHLRVQHQMTHTEDKTSLKTRSTTINPDYSVTDVGKSIKPCRCSKCGKIFPCHSALQMHMFVHTRERPFKCLTCVKCFKQKTHLIRHQRIHTGVKSYSCTVCKKQFTDNLKLCAHLRTHVEDGTLDQSSVINPDSSVTDVGEHAKPCRCSDCGKRFVSNSALQRHVLSHTGQRPFRCSVCKKAFKQKTHLTRHLKRLHHICPVCKKHFTNKINLSAHLRTHVEDGTLDRDSSVTDVEGISRPHECSECGKRYSFSTGLKRHMLDHTGERPYKCSKCEKCFKQKPHLTTHLKTHTGEKQLQCTVCEKGFKHKSQLTKHLKRLHHICPVY